MVEEECEDDSTNKTMQGPGDDDTVDTTIDFAHDTPSIFNSLNSSLCCLLALSAAATSIPIGLVTTISEFDDKEFLTSCVAAAVWGTSVGKFVNGMLADMVGARRTTLVYAFLLSISLVRLAMATTPSQAIWACFWTEFCASVQWPAVIATLATHYRGHGSLYDGGIYLASLASHVGSLGGIVGSSLLTHANVHWRIIAAIGAWMALQASAVSYLYVWDAPTQRNQPQNPIDPALWRHYHSSSIQALSTRNEFGVGEWTVAPVFEWVNFLLSTMILPSMRHVLGSSFFWLVAVAHSGSSMAKSSLRIVATYLADTNSSRNDISHLNMAGLSVFLSVGTVLGLVIAGHLFAVPTQQMRSRKWLVSKLYLTMIVSCYVLAALAVPSVGHALDDLTLVLQVLALFMLGFGTSVPYYHLPSLVSANFPQHKALFLSLTEGVAYGIAGWLWKIVGRIVAASDDGWAYGWACVALLLILTAVLMVEFLEHFYCRPQQTGPDGGVYETIVFA